MTNFLRQIVTPVTDPLVPLSCVLRACQRWILIGVTAQILTVMLAVRGQLRTSHMEDLTHLGDTPII